VVGADEPFYRAAQGDNPAAILSREDFISSALHEIAHWCVAGDARRQMDDYGYWYEPDGRTPEQQAEFEKVEIKPQAIEWAFSIACCHDFHFSADNLNGEAGPSFSFQRNVYECLRSMWPNRLPKRAQQLFDAMVNAFCNGRIPECPSAPVSVESILPDQRRLPSHHASTVDRSATEPCIESTLITARSCDKNEPSSLASSAENQYV